MILKSRLISKSIMAVHKRTRGRIVVLTGAMRSLPSILDKPLLAGLVVCQEDSVRRWDGDIPLYSLPAGWLLS